MGKMESLRLPHLDVPATVAWQCSGGPEQGPACADEALLCNLKVRIWHPASFVCTQHIRESGLPHRGTCSATHGLWCVCIAPAQNKGRSDIQTALRTFFHLPEPHVNPPSIEWLRDTQRLGQVLNLGVVSWALFNTSDATWGLWFPFQEVPSSETLVSWPLW